MGQTHLYLSWLLALGATLGSYYFSNILNFPPCTLCWWQRIFLFPLVFILGAAFLRKDSKGHYYSLPLILCGFFLSLYHNLLYWGVIAKPITACSAGVSCTEKQIEWFGFITIPLLSFTAFAVLLAIHLHSIYLTKEQSQ